MRTCWCWEWPWAAMAVNTHGAWNVSQRLCDAAMMRGQQAASDERGPSQLQPSPHSAEQHTAVTLHGHPPWPPLHHLMRIARGHTACLHGRTTSETAASLESAVHHPVGQRTRRPPQW